MATNTVNSNDSVDQSMTGDFTEKMDTSFPDKDNTDSKDREREKVVSTAPISEQLIDKKFSDIEKGLKKTFKKEIEKKAKETENQLKKIVDVSKKGLKEDQDALKDYLTKKIDDSKLSIIETLGIFVALFTFISIDIQILKSTFNLLAITGLIFVTLGALLFFAIVLHVLVTEHTEKIDYKFWVGLFLTIVLLLLGTFLIYENNQNTYEIISKEQFEKDYVQVVNKSSADFTSFKTCLKNNGWRNSCLQ